MNSRSYRSIDSRRIASRHCGFLFVFICMSTITLPLLAQSRGSATRGSSTRQSTTNSVALSGYCPVCITDMKKWVRGNPQFAATYDGKTYHFPSAETRERFLANPVKYAPVLGGDCVVCLAKMGKRMPGSVLHAAYHGGRLFLFPGKDQKQMFVDNPQAYADVDLALNGDCAVCLKEMGKQMPGKPEHTIIHNGMRYQFPGEDQAEMFMAYPKKYMNLELPKPGPSSSAQPKATSKIVVISGKSGCAGCDYGVTPIGSDELGLAVKSTEGKVFIVEDAHMLYPKLYEKRFEGLNVNLQGEVVKTDGEFTWVRPLSLTSTL